MPLGRRLCHWDEQCPRGRASSAGLKRTPTIAEPLLVTMTVPPLSRYGPLSGSGPPVSGQGSTKLPKKASRQPVPARAASRRVNAHLDSGLVYALVLAQFADYSCVLGLGREALTRANELFRRCQRDPEVLNHVLVRTVSALLREDADEPAGPTDYRLGWGLGAQPRPQQTKHALRKGHYNWEGPKGSRP